MISRKLFIDTLKNNSTSLGINLDASLYYFYIKFILFIKS